MVREAHGLEQLMGIVKDKNLRDNKKLLAAATGALWKCTLVEDNVKQLDNVINRLRKRSEHFNQFNQFNLCVAVPVSAYSLFSCAY